MTATGPWVCGNCRSVNREADSRCYSCRTPRALALNPEALDLGRQAAAAATASPTQQAATARALGAKDRDADPLAVLTQVAVLIVAAVTLARTVLVITFAQGLEGGIADPETFDLQAAIDHEVFLGLLQYVVLGAWVAGLVAWGAWLARVVANVPALGGGWTAETPRFAFISTLIPGGNLYWTTSTMRQVITALSPAGAPRLGLITAWWLATTPMLILLMNVGPLRWLRSIVETVVGTLLLIISGGDITSLLDATILVELIGGALLLASAGLAILLVQAIERLQAERRAALGAGISPA
jgi:hypothetical protein